MSVLNVEESPLSKIRVDRATGASKPAHPSDVHDIRSLTATGAIPLPGHRQHRKAESEQGTDQR
jgi:hypothetical protein